MELWDYKSPGLQHRTVDHMFPRRVLTSPDSNPWPHLRRNIPHRWYTDDRDRLVGFISTDEAAILYGNAAIFAGQAGVEIGCWRGWSSAHIITAGIQLDIIDPVLAKPEFRTELQCLVQTLDAEIQTRLYGYTSPAALRTAKALRGAPWSFAFIDGNHEKPAPFNDARAVAELMSNDALILFHDLSSPDVAEGLNILRVSGWSTMVYMTMQIMGVAWRGKVNPVTHVPDPRIKWELPSHLDIYSVCGM
ncbi:MAG: hypothetical protein CTY31_06280 [Hyphomicrobium sp.]|nr:MAG: hypothetical protein CTY31_06280 [Hyphomicrobium sp.]